MVVEKWLETLSKKTRIYFLFEKPIDGIEKLREIDRSRFGWIGSFSVSSRKTKVYKYWQPEVIFNGVQLIGTEIAKLLIMLNKPPRGYRGITARQLEETPPPLYACPGTLEEGVYIDIKSCYYHLITKLWGIKYARNLWLGRDKEIGNWHVPQEIESILQEYKTIRNAIYGIMRAKLRVIWKEENGKITYSVQKTKNELFYPDVPLAILDITHAISTFAVKKFSAQYVAIDGFILPYSQAEAFQAYLAEYGFKSGIKAEGLAVIKNFYTYAIGEKVSKTFSKYKTAPQTQSNLLFSLSEAQEILAKFRHLLQS